ncbi:MAG: ParB-like nuclease domain-containing protein, partial [Myxococcaceae bacterium]|nr:ParB-like nuclease domain-containing protein [Myxococcaceae bacterium]
MPDVNEQTEENPISGGESAPAESPSVASGDTAPESPSETARETVAAEAPAPLPLSSPPSPSPHELKRVHPAPEQISLDGVDDDVTFKIRDEGDISALAMDIARVGQVFPIDLRAKGDRFQIITGFRRVAALKFLHRDRVLARLHHELSDEDAALIALAEAIHSEPVSREELGGMRERLESRGWLSAAARDMFEKALAEGEALAPEEAPGEEEVDADELAADVATRLGQINQDLSLLADVF